MVGDLYIHLVDENKRIKIRGEKQRSIPPTLTRFHPSVTQIKNNNMPIMPNYGVKHVDPPLVSYPL